MRQGDAPSHDSETFLGMGCLLVLWLKKKSKLPAEGITLNGDISGNANKLIFPSEKVEKRNRGKVLRRINKKF